MSDSGLSVLPTLPSTPGESPPSFDSLKGTERFETGELIGKGGMGQVFSCTDLKLKRSMAVKQATSCSAVDLERFVREARALAPRRASTSPPPLGCRSPTRRLPGTRC